MSRNFNRLISGTSVAVLCAIGASACEGDSGSSNAPESVSIVANQGSIVVDSNAVLRYGTYADGIEIIVDPTAEGSLRDVINTACDRPGVGLCTMTSHMAKFEESPQQAGQYLVTFAFDVKKGSRDCITTVDAHANLTHSPDGTHSLVFVDMLPDSDVDFLVNEIC